MLKRIHRFVFWGGWGVLTACASPDPENPADLTVVEMSNGDGFPGIEHNRSVVAVANSRFNSVTLMDIDSYEIHTIPTGLYPQAITHNAQERWVATANRGDSTISLIDIDTHRVRMLETDGEPIAILAQVGTDRLWTANWSDDSLSVIDISTGRRETLSIGGGPCSLAQTPDGSRVYALTHFDGGITEYDGRSHEITGRFDWPEWPRQGDHPRAQLRITPSGRTLVASHPFALQVGLIDLSGRKSRFLDVPFVPVAVFAAGEERAFVTGRTYREDCFYPASEGYWLGCFDEDWDGWMAEIDLVLGRIHNIRLLEDSPRGGIASLDGRRVYGAEYGDFRDMRNNRRVSLLHAFDAEEGSRRSIEVPPLPLQLGLAKNDTRLVISHGNPLGGLTVVDTHRMEILFHRAGLAIGDLR